MNSLNNSLEKYSCASKMPYCRIYEKFRKTVIGTHSLVYPSIIVINLMATGNKTCLKLMRIRSLNKA